MRTILLLSTTLCAACATAAPDVRLAVPQVAPELFVVPEPPEPPVGGTQADIARFIVLQDEARSICYGNLDAVRETLAKWRAK